jgi:hypothetical protein
VLELVINLTVVEYQLVEDGPRDTFPRRVCAHMIHAVVKSGAILAFGIVVFTAFPLSAQQRSYKQRPAADARTATVYPGRARADLGKVYCPPEWTRKTTISGNQIGTGEPDNVPPVGCVK